MKPLRLLPILACFSIICALFSGVASALDQDEASVSLIWFDQTPYQGSSVTVSVFFESDCSEELKIYYIGLHFDWMASDSFVGSDLSNDPVTIPSYGSHTFGPMMIHIPHNASVGIHSYYVGIDGLQGGSIGFSWDSQIQMLLIKDPQEEVYNELVTKVASNITTAVNAKYQSSQAQSLLDQAANAYAQALMLANQENWEEAISALQNAIIYLEQADVEEQNYIKAKSQQDQLLIIVGVAVVVAAAVLIILMVRKKRKQTAPVDQPAARAKPRGS